jgi:hypothetical protein
MLFCFFWLYLIKYKPPNTRIKPPDKFHAKDGSPVLGISIAPPSEGGGISNGGALVGKVGLVGESVSGVEVGNGAGVGADVGTSTVSPGLFVVMPGLLGVKPPGAEVRSGEL